MQEFLSSIFQNYEEFAALRPKILHGGAYIGYQKICDRALGVLRDAVPAVSDFEKLDALLWAELKERIKPRRSPGVRHRRKEYDNRREYRIAGLKRSGHHAIIEWILNQESGTKCFVNDVNPYVSPFFWCGGLEWSDRSKRLNLLEEGLGKHRPKDVLMYNFEDFALNDIFHSRFDAWQEHFLGRSREKFNILILRDPFNLIASRLSWTLARPAFFSGGAKSPFQTVFLKKVPELWKRYAREFLGKTSVIPRKVLINYNLWFLSREYRVEVSKALGLRHSDSAIHRVPSQGGGSTFDGLKYKQSARRMKVLERWKAFLKEPAFQRIFADREIVSLSLRIFGHIPGTEAIHKNIASQSSNG